MAAIIMVGGLDATMGKLKEQNVIRAKLPEPFVVVNAYNNMQLFEDKIVINYRLMIT